MYKINAQCIMHNYLGEFLVVDNGSVGHHAEGMRRADRRN
jgi:hypothetical protein